MTLKANIDDEKIKQKIAEFHKRFLEKSKTIIEQHSLLLIGHLRSKYMRGATTTDTSIRKRTGSLSASARAITPAKVTEKSVEGGVTFGKVYAKVHIGPKGKITPIEPKHKKWLTVPIPWSPIMRKDGTLKATAAELKEGSKGLPFGDTFIKKSRQGFLIIWGTKRITKGKRLGKTYGDIVPLFVLAKKVKIKTRIHPEDFLKWSKEKLAKDFRKETINVAYKT